MCSVQDAGSNTAGAKAKSQIVEMTGYKLRYGFCENMVTLQVPDFSSCQSSPVISRCTPYTDFVKDHIEFRSQLWHNGDVSPGTLRNLSYTELKAVQKALPGIDNREIVLAMTAWFCTLCAVDDVVEKMDCESAFAALKICSDTLTERLESKILEESKSLTGPTLFLTKVFQAFVAHARFLLPRKTCRGLFAAVRDTLRGQIEELKHRSKLCSSMIVYMKIRISSIGIVPFFNLLEAHFGGPVHLPSRKLHRLQGLVVSAVVLQNDLVGLETDLQSGELINSILVISRLQGIEKEDQRIRQKLDQAMRQIEEDRNFIISQALLTAEAVHTLSN